MQEADGEFMLAFSDSMNACVFCLKVRYLSDSHQSLVSSDRCHSAAMSRA